MLDQQISVLEAKLNTLNDLIVEAQQILHGELPPAASAASDALADTGDAADKAGDKADQAKVSFDLLSHAAGTLLDGIFPLRAEAAEYSATLAKLTEAHEAGAIGTALYEAAIGKLNLDLAAALSGTSDLAGVVDKFAVSQGRYAELEKARATQSKELVKQLETEIITEALLAEVKRSGADIDEERLKQIAALIQSKAGLAATKDEVDKTLKESEKAAKQINSAFDEAARSLHRTIADEIDEALRDMARDPSAAQRYRDLFARQQALENQMRTSS